MAIGGIVIMYVLLLLKNSLPLLLQGLYATLLLWISASIFSIIAGAIMGVLRSNALRIVYISSLFDGITFVLRAVPFYVQLLIAYFVIPSLLHCNISAFCAAVISLGLCSASYVSQIMRGGINAISVGQWEAAKVLGYSMLDTVRFIIVPQTLKIVLPALIGECDQLLKSTSIVSAIGVLELTGAGRNIIAQEMNPLTIYMVLAGMYLVMSAILAYCAVIVEKKMYKQ